MKKLIKEQEEKICEGDIEIILDICWNCSYLNELIKGSIYNIIQETLSYP